MINKVVLKRSKIVKISPIERNFDDALQRLGTVQSTKDVRSQEDGVCPVRKGGVLQMRTSALFSEKNFRIFEIYGVSARSRES